MLSRGQFLVSLALTKARDQAQGPSHTHVKISGNNILIKDKVQSESSTDIEPDSILKDVVDTDKEVYSDVVDDDVRDPDWELPKNQSSDSESSIREPDTSTEVTFTDSNNNRIDGSVEKDRNSPKRRRSRNSLKETNKRRRMHGEFYMGVKKNEHGVKAFSEERSERLLCQSKCSKMCEKKTKYRQCIEIDGETRRDIFKRFWKMDWKQKKVYVVNLVEKVEVAQRTTLDRSRRNFSFKYHLRKKEERLCVCKNMFTSTLSISEKTVHNWVNNASAGFPKPPNRSLKISNSQHLKRETANDFLESLPNVPSHYCRSSSSKKYLEPLFGSLGDVYREYCTQCTEKGTSPFNKTGFLELFHQMNLALWQPKKDQCDICCSFEAGNLDEGVHQAHLKRKNEARESKLLDKGLAFQDNSIKVLSLDLQSLLLCPKLQASSLYYKTKLACHNFTIFDLTTKGVSCYFWHEAEGELTANCFSSCVIDYLYSLDIELVKRVIIYSDGCGYQNRNSILANALLLFSVKTSIAVEQKYLEKGHTQMECDSIHSVVERKIRKKAVYVPQNYVELIREARTTPHPYKVNYIDHEFFKDYSVLNYYPSIRPGTGAGSAVVTDIRVLKYTPEGIILYKTNYSDDFKDIPRPRASRSRTPCRDDTVCSLYNASLRIKKTKYDHLQQLKSVIPPDYHSFYDHLQHT